MEPRPDGWPSKELALSVCWEACGKPCELHSWLEAFGGWGIIPLVVGGVLGGCVLRKGPEVHVGVLPPFSGKWLTKRVYREAILDPIDKYGYVMTTGQKDRDNWFIRRMGFQPVGERNGVIVFKRFA